MNWIPTSDYHNKPQDLENILFVLPSCPYTGEINRVHYGYVIHGKDYYSSKWFTYEFNGYDPVSTMDVLAWVPMPTYKENGELYLALPDEDEIGPPEGPIYPWDHRRYRS